VRDVIQPILDRRGEADESLRQIVDALAERLGWAAIYLVEGEELAPGPSSGLEPDEPAAVVPIRYEGRVIGELRVGRDAEDLDAVADAIAPVCLVAWDTGGVPWSELS
jgi:putative methionine-R-sulfoxide reductase with GAF domain